MEPQLAQKIAELWDREQIRQCLHRYARGVDRFDREMILSAFHPDCLDEHGKFVGTPEEFVNWALAMHEGAHLSHQHCLLNHTAEIAGDTAHAETYFLFVSMNRKGKPRRTKYKVTTGSDWKRAIVALAEDSRIELF